MTRSEHIEWAKTRALEYVDTGDTQQAFSSLASDLRKHKETENHPAIQLGMLIMMSGKLESETEMKEFIDGCH